MHGILKYDSCRLKAKECYDAGIVGRDVEDIVGVDVDDPGEKKGEEDFGVAGQEPGGVGAGREEGAWEVQKVMGNEGGDGFEWLTALLVPE